MAKKKVTKKKKSVDGRPTGYRPKYCKEIIDYFSIPTKVIKQKEVATNRGVEIINEEKANEFPTIEGFCAKMKMSKQTLHNWTKKHPDFMDAYNTAKNYQLNHIVQNGLDGGYNQAFAKFVMINCTHYTEKIEQEVTNRNIEIKIDEQDAGL